MALPGPDALTQARDFFLIQVFELFFYEFQAPIDLGQEHILEGTRVPPAWD